MSDKKIIFTIGTIKIDTILDESACESIVYQFRLNKRIVYEIESAMETIYIDLSKVLIIEIENLED